MKWIKAQINFLFESRLFLVLGAACALLWAFIDYQGYEHFLHTEWFGHTVHWWVGDVAMALFFLLVSIEIREAFLPGGDLYAPSRGELLKRASVPVVATLGGMAMPAAVYCGLALILDRQDLMRGWAIPIATDIAFSAFAARKIFGVHPAVTLLLTIAILDDAGGLVVLAAFFPQKPIELGSFLMLQASGAIAAIALRKLQVRTFWLYLLIPGSLFWVGFEIGGIHPALGLVSLALFLPHAKHDVALFAIEEETFTDTANQLQHFFKRPVEIILFFFALTSAGVPMTSPGTTTYLVVAGLLLGKPLGIVLFTWVGCALGLKMPQGMGMRELIVVGMAAGIGFTVALFVAGLAFPAGTIELEHGKMGALMSFFAIALSFGAAWLLGLWSPFERDVKGSPVTTTPIEQIEIET